MNLRIAFIGPMRAGKDTAAEMCQRQYGGENMKFAQPLYDMQDYIYRRSHLPQGNKDRLLLQWLGTDWGRSMDPNIWVNIFLKDLESKEGNIYVTDCRFKNEVHLLRENGFKLLKVNRPLEERIKAGASLMTHASEMDLQDFTDYDGSIDNSSDLATFNEKVLEIIKY